MEGIDDGGHCVVVFLFLYPFALPYDDDAIAHVDESVFFAFGNFVYVSHGLITHFLKRFVAVGVTYGTLVPKTTVVFLYTMFICALYPCTKKVLLPRRITCSPPLRAF